MANRALDAVHKFKTTINTTDDRSRPTMWIAAGKGYADMVSLLLGVDGVDVNIEAKCGRNMWNALFHAYWKKRDKALGVLIQSRRLDLNAKCSTGGRPYRRVSETTGRKSLRVLLNSCQVDVNVRGL